jgi:hypothetical protein
MSHARLANADIADMMEKAADLLEAQEANPFRVLAYAEAAATIRAMGDRVTDLLESEGRSALAEIPGIGSRLSRSLEEVVRSGRLPLLDRLLGEVAPGDLFATVPGIGTKLARRIQRRLDIETLEELELAAHDGRLEEVEGFGPRRARLVRDALDAMPDRTVRRRTRWVGQADESDSPSDSPSVALLLEVDTRYRRKAAAGELRTIAPRRFNPQRRAWLPILHDDEDGWSFIVMYSNTARAHELDKTDDWVVVVYERDGKERRCTVVTETRGAFSGKRVVRGREEESARFYRRRNRLREG